jgi:hypothetical protein
LNPFLHFCRRLLPWCGGLLATAPLLAAPPEPSADSALQAAAQLDRTNPIAPTVTREMGDVGGKFFGHPPDPAKTRHYYIAAELDAWDFAPENRDPVCGKPLPPHIADTHTAIKVRYFQYTDATFTRRVIENPRLGLLGPVLRGVTGETLAVTFYNRTELPLSMHPHGVKYDKDSEGAYTRPSPGLGAAVGPQGKFTYVWVLDEQSGPLPGEPSSRAWLYHSHVHGDAEANLGLVGTIIVTDPKRARPDGTPADVDREMVSLFMIFNESGFDEEAMEAAAAGDPSQLSWADLQQQSEQGSRFAINGRIFGNLTGQEMNEGERVRWYLLGLGDEVDMHTAHWHGLRVIEDGRRRTDVVELLPATMKVADLLADNPGTWLFHCHVAEHMREGMFAPVVVHAKSGEKGLAPDPAFFGLRSAEQSLRIPRAVAALDFAPGAAQPCELRMQGMVTVPAAFAVAKVPIRLRLGEKSVVANAGTDGRAEAEEFVCRILNGGRYGVVGDQLMQFSVTLRGAGWLEELKKLGAVADGALVRDKAVDLKMQVGEIEHSTTVHFTAP